MFEGKFRDGEFQGEVVSKVGEGRIGKIILKKNGVARPSFPLVETVWGAYRGFCNAGSTHLQLYTFLSTEKTDDTGNPFGSYEIVGQFGKNPGLCPSSSNPPDFDTTESVGHGVTLKIIGDLSTKNENSKCSV
jgi:hypothetical protein